MKESFVFLAEGFEEIEAITVIDLLRRAGMPVKTVSITTALQVTGAHGVTIKADLIFDNTLFKDAAWLILPGGMPGATNLFEFGPLEGLLKAQLDTEGGRIAALCASPAVVLGQMGLLRHEKATCYPGFEEKLDGAEVVDSPVVVSGKFVTGNGPASAMAWALTIISETLSSQDALRVANGLLLYPRDNKEVDHFFG